MKMLIAAGLAMAALALPLLSVRAQEPCGCCAAPVEPTHVTFRIEEDSQKCLVKKTVPNVSKVKERVFVQEVPCTRTVDVCVKDPATGCERIETKVEPYNKKITTLCIEVIPPDHDYSCKMVEELHKTITVHMSADVPQPCCCHH